MIGTETTEITCPYCGERLEIVIDPSVEHQRYIEDCAVCCRPVDLEVQTNVDGKISVRSRHESEC